ncbi:MAG: acetyl-CoA carboxylase carboxyltransferase subunit alpha [bacterium]
MDHVLEFERELDDLEKRISELKRFAAGGNASLGDELERLERKLDKRRAEIFQGLTPWQVTQLARHPARPQALDFIERLFDDWIELHGDRGYGDDPAILSGLARFQGTPVVVVGHQKGRRTGEKVRRNFGMPHPEGYRKAQRLFALAERFHLPVMTFVDTPGAYPGIGAEERGQAEAIAVSIQTMIDLGVPILVTVIGEGGSGGALALGVGDRVFMLRHAVYSVISPEGCAGILWNDGQRAETAAAALKMTAPDLLSLGVIDAIVEEPRGGAHRDPDEAARLVGETLSQALDQVRGLAIPDLVEARYQKFRSIGVFQSR